MKTEEYNKSVEDYADSIYRFIIKSIRDVEKAKDITQDAFEKLWINADMVPATKSRSFLFTTAYHTMIDQLRREKRKVDFETVNLQYYSHEDHYYGLQEVLHVALNRLPEIQRSVVLLRDYEGYSYEEISEITGLNKSQVKVYIYRARVFLKNYIGSPETVI
jgi:RNA polymerase sigma-70 factor (ECF subfamily)